ncbi:sigma 54-interacting transcriptional regulator [Lewinella sp. JB7]|uniref:sigma 54-interacting transcriptional regulator n=1 Tax=Lewinella sp. JB7 TaxID=2962887 RepID=UPI0020C9D2D5|nr:sigma 54-interacting transcriptional regulator [Lewinella sp. JB7]MCP9235668.1 sigma 54-interacting transcriptional regulator [Lewinella sp. JB7]
MPELAEALVKILETVPFPAFVALSDGSIVVANSSLTGISGQPDLATMDRTLYGLGIFHNPAEYRGFLQSFKHGGGPRRLVLPVGRFGSDHRPLVLFASRIEYAGESALCGIITRNANGGGAETIREYTPSGNDDLLDKLGCFTMRVDAEGKLLYVNFPMQLELGIQRKKQLPHLTRIDAENDSAAIKRLLELARNHGSTTYETTYQRENGTLIPVEALVKAMRKPEYDGQFLITAFDITEKRRAQRELQTLEIENEKLLLQLESRAAQVDTKPASQDSQRIISESPAYVRVLRQIEQVASTNSTVLITGETGTGKELIARAIHAASRRAARPLVILNCGALPAELIESELFGYRKGAFTGARGDHLGRFELADEGTLFLDEIGEMPMLLQTRLLRVLQDGEFTPLGARESVHTNVRIIAATNRDLRKRVAEGTFRSDLYFRLNVFPIHSVPLRDRPEDIPVLVDHFIRKYAPPHRARPVLRPHDLARLADYPFDGNVRELENIIQRALIVSSGKYLEINLESYITASSSATAPAAAVQVPLPGQVLDFTEMQRQHIQSVLNLTDGKVSGKGGAAEILGLNPQTLFSKMRKLGIDRRGAKS